MSLYACDGTTLLENSANRTFVNQPFKRGGCWKCIPNCSGLTRKMTFRTYLSPRFPNYWKSLKMGSFDHNPNLAFRVWHCHTRKSKTGHSVGQWRCYCAPSHIGISTDSGRGGRVVKNANLCSQKGSKKLYLFMSSYLCTEEDKCSQTCLSCSGTLHHSDKDLKRIHPLPGRSVSLGSLGHSSRHSH